MNKSVAVQLSCVQAIAGLYNTIYIFSQEVIEQKQRAELAASEVIIAGLKEEIGDYERRLSTVEADTEALRQQVADKDRQIAEVEAQAR
jgi:hypothetical protein